MRIAKAQISKQNEQLQASHESSLNFISARLQEKGKDPETIIQRLMDFQVAIPSWALGAGGTRFGRFSFGGEPTNLSQKIADVGLVHALTQTAGSISLHIPWDTPEDFDATRILAESFGLEFDAVNSNTFQDQSAQSHSYKFGSLCHVDARVRNQAIAHNLEVIRIGEGLGSKSLTVWLADGASFPGQHNMRKALERTMDSLRQIYAGMPKDWSMFVEYKPYEPNFYSTVIQDWGTSLLLAESLGPQASCLVDLGHHLPNTNIEQIVATLLMKGRLGGFHFNDSKYGDDDLTVGSVKPYQLFLIFQELVDGMEAYGLHASDIAWMIDASHNLKDPLEDLIQSLDAILIAYAKALVVDRASLEHAQHACDPTLAQEILQDAYRTDIRPLVREARRRTGGAIDPIRTFRSLGIRKQLIAERGEFAVATGL
ncbi:sugar isomerase [Pontibacter sp. G13]|uniref:sugar isomerase n=1 Tax=Pontibacter sp. G13 TaxID=3074898 RepID=UPI0028896C28|nr:sugar isomerase [Pontibacter sp. G13]WNJ19019.1 sugar isomerase [Pontibacter sp. G13]